MSVVARVGENCWQRPYAARAAMLVDAEEYFAALASALERAERSVLILGWDFHEATRLVHDGTVPGETVRELLVRRLRRERHLQVRILDWSFNIVFVTERELFPSFRRRWGAPRRIDFRYDDAHPPGASHHQKVIVVDDSIAFCGGLDVTARRWDTREHRPHEPRRIDPWGGGYEPFHDVQMAVDGDAAVALGVLARRRWHRATGEWLPAVAPAFRGDRWPAHLRPDFRNVPVAVARSEPAFEGEPEVREVERLFLDGIAAARRTILFENQYLSSHAIAAALERRLAEPDGPEIAIVGPSQSSGFLEDLAMGAMRSRILARLTACGGAGRIAAFSPVVGRVTPVMVHSKVMIVDDQLLRVGSANLCNRSMSLDTECDLQIEADGDGAVAARIAERRDDLLAEHLGVSPARVRDTLARDPSLIRAIDTLGTAERRLVRIEPCDPTVLASVLEATTPFDAEQPVDAARLLVALGVDRTSVRAGRGLIGAAALVAAVLLAWRFGPFAGWLDPGWLRGAVHHVAAIPTGPLVAALAIALASLLMVPITVLVMVAGLVFGPWIGFGVAISGSLLGALVGYGIGAQLWRGTVRRLAGRRINTISRYLLRRTMGAMALVRLVPFAPFAVVNLIAGSRRIGVRPFAFGTLLGMAPGTFALCLTADRVAAGRPLEAALIVACGLVVTVGLTGALHAQEA